MSEKRTSNEVAAIAAKVLKIKGPEKTVIYFFAKDMTVTDVLTLGEIRTLALTQAADKPKATRKRGRK